MHTATVLEAHLSTGKTIPLRALAAATSGNRYWGTVQQTKTGPKFGSYGVNVDQEKYVGDIAAVTSITVKATEGSPVRKDMVVPVKHDQNEKGKARITAEETFTGSDGEKWVFAYRATLMDAGIVNLKAAVRRAGGSVGPRVQAEL